MRSGSAACRNRLTHLPMDLVTRGASRLIGLLFSTRSGTGPGARDRRAAEHHVAVIEDRGLPGCDTAHRLAQADPHPVAGRLADRRVALAVCAQLDQALDRTGRWRAARPHGSGRLDLPHVQALRRADGDGAGRRLVTQHIARPAVRRRTIDPHSLALPDRKPVASVMVPHHGAVLIDELTGGAAELAPQEPPGVAVGDEAHVVAVRLVCYRETPLCRFLAHLVLGGSAQREHGPAQLLAGEHA